MSVLAAQRTPSHGAELLSPSLQQAATVPSPQRQAFSLKVTDSRISPEVSCSSLRKENSCSPSSSSPKHLERLKTIIKSFLCFFFSGRHPTSFPPWGLFPEPCCSKIPIALAVLRVLLGPLKSRGPGSRGWGGRADAGTDSLTWLHCCEAWKGPPPTSTNCQALAPCPSGRTVPL